MRILDHLKLFFIIFTSRCITSCFASCDKFRRVNEMLIKNLIKYHESTSDHFEINSEHASETARDDLKVIPNIQIYKIPYTARRYILSFLDSESINSFNIISKYIYKNHAIFIKESLLKFSSFFVFEEFWMNRIMYVFLQDIFFGVHSLRDPEIYDRFLLANVFFILQKETYKCLSSTMIRILFCFVHKILKFPGANIASTVSQWKALYAQCLFDYKLPKCTEFYINLFEKSHSHQKNLVISFREKVSIIIEFINSNPGDSSLMEYYTANFSSNNFLLQNCEELSVAFIQKFHFKLVSGKNIKNAFILLNGYRVFSQILFDRFFSIDYIKDHILDLYYKDTQMMRAYYKEASIDQNDPLKYLWTRDHLNLFDMKEFMLLKGNSVSNFKLLILQIIKTSDSDLVHFDAFIKLIRSEIYYSQDNNFLNFLIGILVCHNNSIFYKIFTVEIITSVNYFSATSLITCGCDLNFIGAQEYRHAFDREAIFSHSQPGFYFQNLKIYIQSLKNDDPFPILFFTRIHLNTLRTLIAKKKFNLRLRYKFDEDFSRVRIKNVSKSVLITLYGKILTFKEIIDQIFPELEGFYEIFLNNSIDTKNSENENEHINNEFYCPISLSKFLHKGVLEPIRDEKICVIC